MKYIFLAGAPGSKWSSVAKNIYYSPSIDRSDYREAWTYYHDASGRKELMHQGAYFDPGMECDIPADLSKLSRTELEAIFDKPFDKNSTGTRIIKSHIFCNNIHTLREKFPECAVVLVYRGDDSCLGWWVKCGHFNITYPLYHNYYKDLKQMARIIQQQNRDLLNARSHYDGKHVSTNRELAQVLGLEPPPLIYAQDYAASDIEVTVI